MPTEAEEVVVWRAFRRRRLILAIALFPMLPVVAQTERKSKRVAILTLRMDADSLEEVRNIALKQFGQHGLSQGVNLELKVFNAQRRDLRENAAREAIVWKPDLIMCFGTNAARTAKSLTSVPIVFLDVSEPVRAGLALSLNKPGGNLTGTSGRFVDLMAKRLELLSELAPNRKRVAVLTSAGSAPTAIEELSRASLKLNVHVIEIRVPENADFDFVRSALTASHADAVMVVGWDRFAEFEAQTLEYFKTTRMPSAWEAMRQVERGGLVSIGPPDVEMLVGGVDIAVRILRGEPPGSIPVNQITRVQITLNLVTARELGLQVPSHVLLRADRVVK